MFVQSHAFSAPAMHDGREQISFGGPQRTAETARAALVRERDADLQFWRPVYSNCTDIICGEIAAHALPIRMYETIQVMLPGTRFDVVDGRGRPRPVYPGQVYVTGPLVLHGIKGSDHRPFNMRLMQLPASATSLGKPGRTSSDRERPDQWIVDDEALYAELWTAFDALKGPLAANDDSYSMRAVLTKIIASEPTAPTSVSSVAEPRSSGLARVSEYLRANVTVDVTLDDLSVTAGLSKFYLLRAFRNSYGLTPHAYQMQLRLARAWRLVAEGKPLSWAAYDCGFADQSHLTRRFASLFGLTPGAFARQLTLRALGNRMAQVGRHEMLAPSAA